MNLFLSLFVVAICEARRVTVNQKLAILQEDVENLRSSALSLRDDVQLLLMWRNASLTYDDLSDEVSKAGQICESGDSKNCEQTKTLSKPKHDYENFVAATEARFDYLIRGLEAEKVALRKIIQNDRKEKNGLLIEMAMGLKDTASKVEKSHIRVNSIENSQRSMFADITKAIESTKEHVTTEIREHKFDTKKETDEPSSNMESLNPVIQLLCVGMAEQRGWVPFQYSLYMRFNLSTTKNEASAHCSAFGAYLVRVGSDEEMKFLLDIFDSSYHAFWIDGSDYESEGDWRYSDGEKLSYTKWLDGEPNDKNGNEDCIETGSQYSEWNDVSCDSDIHNFVCEIDNAYNMHVTKTPQNDMMYVFENYKENEENISLYYDYIN